jgi:hypothetical protein
MIVGISSRNACIVSGSETLWDISARIMEIIECFSAQVNAKGGCQPLPHNPWTGVAGLARAGLKLLGDDGLESCQDLVLSSDETTMGNGRLKLNSSSSVMAIRVGLRMPSLVVR